MAARATTASKAKPKTRTAAKASARVTKKKAAESTDDAPVATVTKPRRKAKAESRTRIYWAVFNQNLKRVALFEFDQKGEAEKRAAKLQDKSGEYHFIQKQKVAVT